MEHRRVTPAASSSSSASPREPFKSTASATQKRRLVGKKGLKKLYSCPDCNKIFQKLSAFVSHRRKHTGEKPFHCDLCPKRFPQKANLIRHRKLVHFPEQIQKLPCPECGKSFKLKADLLRHQRIHQDRKPFACVFCPKKFTQSNDLHSHHRGHTQERSYFCDFCPQTYTTNMLLKLHRSGHTGDKYYKCPHPHCTVEFFYRPLLIAHRRQFHKEDVGVGYTCVFCTDGIESMTRTRLKEHFLRKRLGEKPHFCKDCSMTFVTASECTRHSNTKHHGGEKKFRCYLCLMKFYSYGKLRTHMRHLHQNQDRGD